MGFLGDLFASKGSVEVRVSVVKLPKGAAYKYRVGFVRVTDAAKPRPTSAPDDTRWSGGFTDANSLEKSLPVGAYWMVVSVQPLLRGNDGELKKDKNRVVPFWPLERPFNVTKGDKSIVRVDIAFPAAGLS